jgi:hypothetical protein
MKPSFVPWPHISNLPNLQHKCLAQNDQVAFVYRAKVKLHGTNAGIAITADSMRAQGHHQFLPEHESERNVSQLLYHPGNQDYFRAVFTNWANKHKDLVQAVIYGEWAGRGVQKFVAISHAEPFFAVFSILLVLADDSLVMLTEPDQITLELDSVPYRPCNLHVIPWHHLDEHLFVQPCDTESVARALLLLEPKVAAIDTCDPWAQAVLSLEGPGEGLVLYPQALDPTQTWVAFTRYAFKVKGRTHLGPKQIAQISQSELKNDELSQSKSILAVLETLDIEPRVRQAIAVVQEKQSGLLPNQQRLTKKDTPDIVDWVFADVLRECKAELAAAGMVDGLTPALKRLLKTRVCYLFHAALKKSVAVQV